MSDCKACYRSVINGGFNLNGVHYQRERLASYEGCLIKIYETTDWLIIHNSSNEIICTIKKQQNGGN